jgi:type II secretory pathway pseudopilin PulG
MMERGTTLLELMLAVALTVIVVATITLSLPKASRSLSVARYRWQASNFASARIQQLKAQTYSTVPLTTLDPTNFPTPCDCNAVNIAVPYFQDDVMTDGTVTYTRYLCVNLIQPSIAPPPPYFVAACWNGSSGPGGADQGLKSIRVRVTWTLPPGDIYSTDAETIVTQL